MINVNIGYTYGWEKVDNLTIKESWLILFLPPSPPTPPPFLTFLTKLSLLLVWSNLNQINYHFLRVKKSSRKKRFAVAKMVCIDNLLLHTFRGGIYMYFGTRLTYRVDGLESLQIYIKTTDVLPYKV
jgi:hypothetical protein